MLLTLYYARSYGLLPRPIAGTDQLTMLEAADNLTAGKVPGAGYMYSYSYTLFLYLLNLPAAGSLIVMRVIQAVVCAFIPVVIYKLCRNLRFRKPQAQLAAILYCFYGPALLISLDFLRAGPLALCFLLAANSLASGFIRKKREPYFHAGMLMGLCILGRENFIPVAAAPLAMLLYPVIRKHVKKTFIANYAVGIVILLVPVAIYNLAMFKSFSLVPGHWQNVMGAHHAEAAGDSGRTIVAITAGMPRQAMNFLGSYEIPNSLSFYAHREIIEFLRVFIIPVNFFIALSLTALAFKFRNKAVIFIGILIAVYAASMLPFNMFYRFRIPSVPLLCCLGSAGIMLIGEGFRDRRFAHTAIACALFLLFFLLTAQNTFALRPLGEKRSVARLLIQRGRYNEAITILEKLPLDDPATARCKTRLLQKLDASGEKARAQELYKKWRAQQQEFAKKQVPPSNRN
ncbi:MAG: glycosyltransferase family 39 protein [Victivallales bacterium]|nr:glycosyltransferase family 39 protein [Victivallales bacterium]